MEWISLKDTLPPYVDVDNYGDWFPVLVFSREKPGNCCVAYLCKICNEEDFNYGELSWNIYVPGENGDVLMGIYFTEFTHWMPLPPPPFHYRSVVSSSYANHPEFPEGCGVVN